MHIVEQVAQFSRQNKVPIADSPCIPPKERWELGVRLLREEIDELEEACRNRDEVGILDACCDALYILLGRVLEFGMGDVLPKAFDEVHSSNMSKACTSVEEAERTVANYEQQGIICYWQEIEGRYVIFRTTDDKVMKSINYRPANLSQFIL